MEYEIRQFDTPLLRFYANPNETEKSISYNITWINEDKKHLLPIGFIPTNEGLASWINRRIVPKHRAFVSNFLACNGLSTNKPLATVELSKGLSLNDSL